MKKKQQQIICFINDNKIFGFFSTGFPELVYIDCGQYQTIDSFDIIGF